MPPVAADNAFDPLYLIDDLTTDVSTSTRLDLLSWTLAIRLSSKMLPQRD